MGQLLDESVERGMVRHAAQLASSKPPLSAGVLHLTIDFARTVVNRQFGQN